MSSLGVGVLEEPLLAEHKKNRQYLQIHQSYSCQNVDFLNKRMKESDARRMDAFVTTQVCSSVSIYLFCVEVYVQGVTKTTIPS